MPARKVRTTGRQRTSGAAQGSFRLSPARQLLSQPDRRSRLAGRDVTPVGKNASRIVNNRIDLLRSVHYEATRAGLDPQLVLGLMQVESGFRKYAVSSAGARGYMQGHAVLAEITRSTGRFPVRPAHQPALWLHHPAPLSGYRKGRPLSRPWPLQRQPRQARVSQHGQRPPGRTSGATRKPHKRPKALAD